jgi:hypothetical protein
MIVSKDKKHRGVATGKSDKTLKHQKEPKEFDPQILGEEMLEAVILHDRCAPSHCP